VVKDKPRSTIWPEQAEQIEAKLEGDTERKLWVLGYGTGWRRSELYRLRKKDIKDSEIEVHGKERDEAVGLLPEIREVLLANTEDLGPEDSIFRGQRGPLSDNGIWRMAKVMRARGGVQGSTHTLRHGYGTALALQGCDAHTIMRLMRHKSIDEAIRYIHMTESHLTDRQRKYSPLELVRKTRTQNALL
jgi:integrase